MGSLQGGLDARAPIAQSRSKSGSCYLKSALAIEALPSERRPAHRTRLVTLRAETREPDGTWNDRIFPRSPSYGTTMALLVLVAPDLPPIPEWTLPSKDIAKESPPHGD